MESRNSFALIGNDVSHWAASVNTEIQEKAKDLQVQMLQEMTNSAPVDTGMMRESFRTFLSQSKSGTRNIYGVRANKKRASVMHLVAFGHTDWKSRRFIPGDDFPGKIHDKYQRKLEEEIKNIQEGWLRDG